MICAWTLVTEILLNGQGIALLYRRIGKAAADKLTQPQNVDTKQPPGLIGPWLMELHQKMGRIEGLICDISACFRDGWKQMDNIGRQSEHLRISVKGISVKLEEMSKVLHAPAREE